MMKQRMQFRRNTLTSVNDFGQAVLSVVALNTVVGFVESNDRYDNMLNMGEGTFEKTKIIFPWFSGLKTGDSVVITDGSVDTLYQIESIEDDRNKHRQLKCWLVRSEESR